jgi:hypothetical protein
MIPKQLKIQGKTYKIDGPEEILDEADELGHTYAYKCLIRYGHNATEEPQQLRDTILHEVLHALYYENGLANELKTTDDDLEEQVVRRTATGMLQILRDNPQLIKFLLEKD